MPTIEQIIATVRQALPDVQAIYVFGSFGTPFFKADSDIDIAVMSVADLTPIKRWHATEEIAQLLNRNIDLIDIRQASTVMRFQIISTGKRIYCKTETECEIYEDYAYSSYIRFNDERKQLLEETAKIKSQNLQLQTLLQQYAVSRDSSQIYQPTAKNIQNF